MSCFAFYAKPSFDMKSILFVDVDFFKAILFFACPIFLFELSMAAPSAALWSGAPGVILLKSNFLML